MKPFTFYDIYYTPLQALSDEQAGKALRMILKHTANPQARAADWTSGTDTFRF